MQIFWKEVAEANANLDHIAVENLYKKISLALYACAAAIGCFLIPWSKDLIGFMLGAAYVEGAAILAITLLYPLHQTIGQINSTLFFATQNTRLQVKIGAASMMCSLPLAYFILAPPDASMPGLGLGALGMALRLVFFNVLVVNITSYILCRSKRWKFEWFHQISIPFVCLLISTCCYFLANLIGQTTELPFLVKIALALMLYLSLIISTILFFPRIYSIFR